MPNEKMRVLLVSYNLSYLSGKNYKELFDALKSGSGWWHYLDSTWLVATTKAPKELAEQIRPLFDLEKDTFLVIEVEPSYSGWLPRKAWEWMKSSFQAIQKG